MIRLILIILAGVRLQSKQDSHCESCFDFGLTPFWGFKGERLLRLEPVQRYRNDEEICKVSKESFTSNCLFIVISIYRLIFRKGV